MCRHLDDHTIRTPPVTLFLWTTDIPGFKLFTRIPSKTFPSYKRNHTIQWMVNYPMDSNIHPLNNPSLKLKVIEFSRFSFKVLTSSNQFTHHCNNINIVIFLQSVKQGQGSKFQNGQFLTRHTATPNVMKVHVIAMSCHLNYKPFLNIVKWNLT